jgi:hypothetical protein
MKGLVRSWRSALWDSSVEETEAELQEKAVFKFRAAAGLQHDKAPVIASVLWEAIKDTLCIILQSLHLLEFSDSRQGGGGHGGMKQIVSLLHADINT